jgi:hypothetical protein
MPLLVFFLLFQAAGVFAQPNVNDNYVPLDTGAFAYVFTDVKKARPILDVLPVGELKTWQAVIVLDSTNTAAAALFPRESGRRFQVTGWGNYPSFRASFALFIHRNWKRRRVDSGTYWYNNADKLSVIIGARQVFAISWHTPPGSPVPSPAGVQKPQGFSEFQSSASLSCWMENPGIIINKMLNDGGYQVNLPSQLLFANLVSMGQNFYQTVLRLHFDDEQQASEVLENLSHAGTTTPRNDTGAILASVFFTYPPGQNGSTLEIRSAILTEREITLLLRLFLLYW